MPTQRDLRYFYGDESEQFSYFRIPRLLITSPRFKALSTDAKLLYGLLLDRMSLSAKNGWYDERGRVYIYYTLDEIQEDVDCGHNKAVRLLAELDSGKGFGLIERRRQGQGRPTVIYVKRFTTGDSIGSQDFPKEEVCTSANGKSALPESGTLDFPKRESIYTEPNQTESSQLNPSIYPASDWSDRCDCRRVVRESVEYDRLCERYGRDETDGAVELIVDTLCSNRPTIRIGGDDVPAQQVRSRLLALEYDHMEYVFDSLRQSGTRIRNIRAYMLAALYNAPATMSSYYSARLRQDYG